jgi:hypothetical protein
MDIGESNQAVYNRCLKGNDSATEVLDVFLNRIRGYIMSVDVCFLEKLPILDLARLLVEMSKQLGERGLLKCTGDLSQDSNAYRAFLEEHACVLLEVANPEWQPVVEHLQIESFKRLVAPTNIKSATDIYGSGATFACEHWYILAAQKVCNF